MGFYAIRSRTRRSLACVPLLCALAAAPTAALARAPRGGSGGVGVGGGGGGGGAGTPTTPATSPTPAPSRTGTGTGTGTGKAQVKRLKGVVNASGDGITLTVAASGTQGHPLTIGGDAPAGDAGEAIDIETARPASTAWTKVASAVIGSGGAFSVEWTPTTSAQVAMRAVLAPGLPTPSATGSSTSGGSGLSATGSTASAASAASSDLATSPLTIPIFKNAVATIYGPGFWGHHTACGERLTRATLGVASRTLRCGSRVSVYYRGREITVPVVDRGPFANGASWDLTMATAKVLGVKQTVTVGTLALAPASAVAARARA